ncbi:DNA polymerase III subunit gamma/tau [Roseiconus nitratireducens]|uniref:DNA polymerase III subunit gamma/tau n=1 Tax=Roseiconus nitratireducens TaxID=2605748 RepID=A0A5M6CWJ8_9BACT|nr:DNA polymerase III subunit gamma/tau [Roseiconus nitratireducens]KAA5539597.1 DNA polymerase III subunit gamma/tau [Roseiconus nitratireducens]
MSDTVSTEKGSDSASNQDPSYVVVARRYRPRTFEELVGQEHVGRALKNAIETGRVGHAYLFTGARGVGKTSTARIFAKALNNPGGPAAVPDNDSDIAQAIDSGEDIDVIEIDGASNRGIDEIRSLRANVGVRPSRSRYKIYIIDEVHMLTQAAFNALLKTLEEPPEHVKFIFCTTDPEKMPITVLSRCQRFDFAPVEVPKIVKRLREIVTAENAEADEDALELVARRAAGSMRDSQSLLEQVLSFTDGKLTADSVHAMLGTADDDRLHALAQAMSDRDSASALGQLDQAIDAGVDAGRLAEQLLGYFRDLMAVTVGCDASLQRHTAASMHEELKKLGDTWGLQTVLAVVAMIDQTLVRVRHSVYGRVLLEATVIQICNLPDLQAISDLAAAASNGLPLAGQAGGEKKKLTRPTPNPAAEYTAPESSWSDSSSVGSSSAVSPPRTSAPPVAAPQSDRPPVSQPADRSPDSDAPDPNEVTGDGASNVAAGAESTEAESPVRANLDTPTEADTAAVRTDSGGAAVAAPKMKLTASNVRDVFSTALQNVQQMTAAIAATADVQLSGDAEIRLVFPAESSMSMRRMELAEHRGPVCEALAEVVGHPVQLQLAAGTASGVRPAAPPAAAPKLSAKERMERMREIEAHPWVQACIDTFQAEIVKIDPKR